MRPREGILRGTLATLERRERAETFTPRLANGFRLEPLGGERLERGANLAASRLRRREVRVRRRAPLLVQPRRLAPRVRKPPSAAAHVLRPDAVFRPSSAAHRRLPQRRAARRRLLGEARGGARHLRARLLEVARQALGGVLEALGAGSRGDARDTRRERTPLVAVEVHLDARVATVPALVAQKRVELLVVDVPAVSALKRVLAAVSAHAVLIHDPPRAPRARQRLPRGVLLRPMETRKLDHDALEPERRRKLERRLRRVGRHLRGRDAAPPRPVPPQLPDVLRVAVDASVTVHAPRPDARPGFRHGDVDSRNQTTAARDAAAGGVRQLGANRRVRVPNVRAERVQALAPKRNTAGRRTRTGPAARRDPARSPRAERSDAGAADGIRRRVVGPVVDVDGRAAGEGGFEERGVDGVRVRGGNFVAERDVARASGCASLRGGVAEGVRERRRERRGLVGGDFVGGVGGVGGKRARSAASSPPSAPPPPGRGSSVHAASAASRRRAGPETPRRDLAEQRRRHSDAAGGW